MRHVSRNPFGVAATVFIASLPLLIGSSCSKKISPDIITEKAVYQLPRKTDSLEIHFLGTTCFLIKYGNQAVFTDPFISNPPLRKVMFGKVKPDTALIRDFVSEAELRQVKTIVIGHAHYDHLLDLPYVAQFIPSNSTIVGSATAHHLTAAANFPQEKISANEYFATVDKPGRWIYSADSSVRVMPVESDHPPHFAGVTLYGGVYSEDLKEIPEKSRKWKMGEPFAYLIDFLKGGEIRWRIWFQSSAAEFPLGFFPEEVLKEKQTDAAFISVAADINPASYPDRILSFLKPGIIFMAHWENFWRNKYKPLKTVQKGNPEKLYAHLKEKFGTDSQVVIPRPGGRFVMAGR